MLYKTYSAADRLIFSASDYRDIGQSAAMKAIMPLASDPEMCTVISLFLLAVAKTNLSSASFRLLLFNEPEKPLEMEVCTKITEEEKKNAVRDEYGALYTADGLKLIKGPNFETSYTIKKGTVIIGDRSFEGCESLQSINIPDSVTSIGDSAFWGCKSLQSINIPDSVTSIGFGAFLFCTSLKSINIPDSVTSIGFGAFNGCESLIKVDICNKNYYTQDNMLIYSQGNVVSCWSQKEHIVLPDSVTSIVNGAFIGCKSLKSINIPDSVTSIGNYAFMWCESLQSINIPDSVTSIGNSAFCDCRLLNSVIIPDSVTSIGNYAFMWCESLKYIIIPLGTKQKFINLLGMEYASRLIER